MNPDIQIDVITSAILLAAVGGLLVRVDLAARRS